MPQDYCMECGHLLSKNDLECSYCGWSQDDYQNSEAWLNPKNTKEYNGIFYKDHYDIERLIDKLDHDIFET
jgi:hypothetical protein